MGNAVVSFLRANRTGLRVVATFLGLIAAFFFLLSYDPILRHVNIGLAIAQVAAWMSFGIIQILGFFLGLNPHRVGTVMGSGAFEVDVSPACSGAVPMSIYLSAVLAYPTTGRAKLIGAALGLAVIHAVNLVRVTALFFIGLYAHQYFHETHVFVAQALVICVAVALWLYWAARFADAPAH